MMAKLLEMSAAGGVFIAAILLVRAASVNKLPKRAFLALWAAASLRLMAPFQISSPVSVYSAARTLGSAARRGVLSPVQPAAGGQAMALPAPHITPLCAAWLAGAVLLALYFILSHLRRRKRYRASLPVEDRLIKAFLERHRLRRPVQARYSDQIESPLTYGVLYPVILLPKGFERMDGERLAFILTHELCHIQRFDVLFKWLLAAVLCVHWFNPLVIAMYLLASRDIELSCDEAVIRSHGFGARSAYALALVELEEERTRFAPLESGFSRNTLKERITAIMKMKPPTLLRVLISLMLVCALTMAFVTSAPAGQEPLAASGAPLPAGEESPPAPVLPSRDPEPEVRGDDGRNDRRDAEGVGYTQAQYDRLIGAIKPDGYERMSIAEFNRTVYHALYEENGNEDGLFQIYDQALSGVPADNDPNEAFLRNTVQASLEEYNARLSEVYSGQRTDPVFSAYAEALREADVFGERIIAGICYVDYSFSYRILDQDALTVAQRDAFLQQVMRGAQDYCEKHVGQPLEEAEFQKALEEVGGDASSEKIAFTGCTVLGIEND